MHGIIRVSIVLIQLVQFRKSRDFMQTELTQNLDNLKYIDWNQYHFVVARSMLKDNQAALDKIGRSQSWLATLPNKTDLENLAQELKGDRLTQASLILRDATIKAVSVMVDDLDSKDRKLRQAAAKDILDRVGLRAPDKTQVEVMASVAVRALDDVLTQVYGKVEAPVPAGMIVDASFQDDNDDNDDNVDSD